MPITHSQLDKIRSWVVSATIRPHYLRERTATRYTEGWLGPRAGLDGMEHLAHTGMESPNRPAVASRYTNYAIQLSGRDTIPKNVVVFQIYVNYGLLAKFKV